MASQQGDAFGDYMDRGYPATVWGWSLAVLCGAAGVTRYALAPGVPSAVAAFVLAFPLLLAVLFLLHHHLPVRLQWALAIGVALVGPTGYLVQGGDDWWNLGQWGVLPLLILMLVRVGAAGMVGGTEVPSGPPE